MAQVGASKVVLVLMNGDPIAIDTFKTTIPTIVEAFEGGQAAGTGLASVLFGDGKAINSCGVVACVAVVRIYRCCVQCGSNIRSNTLLTQFHGCCSTARIIVEH